MNIVDLLSRSEEIGMLQHKEEVLSLMGFVAGLRPRNVMEIGSWKGGLFYFLCKVASGKKVSIDLDAYGDLDVTMEERNRQMEAWAPGVITIIGDSHAENTRLAARGALWGEPLDFLMIDGDHTYEGCLADWRDYGPLVRPGGWVAFHDIVDTPKHRTSGCMVSRVWAEIEGEKLEISAGREWGGIGLVRRQAI